MCQQVILCQCYVLLVLGDIFILPKDPQKCELACHKSFLGWGKYFLLQVLALVSFLCGGCWKICTHKWGPCKSPADHGQECPAGPAPRCCCFPVEERSTSYLASSEGSISLSLAPGWAQVCFSVSLNWFPGRLCTFWYVLSL